MSSVKIFHKPIRYYLINTLIMLIAVLVLILFVYPIIYTIINSLKTYEDFVAKPQYSFPTDIYWGNYTRVWENNFVRYFFNSVIVAIFVVIFTILLSCTAAFALSKLKFKGRGKLEMFFLLGLMIPYQVILIPLFLSYSKLHLLNSYFSLILPQVAFGMPFAIQLFIAFFKDFENDIFEAAIIDGCSVERAFVNIVLPMCRNVVIAIATVRAIFSWNEYLFAYTFISSRRMMTVVLGLNSFVGEEGLIDWGPTFAAITATVIPTLIIFMFLNKYMVSGLSEGSVKG